MIVKLEIYTASGDLRPMVSAVRLLFWAIGKDQIKGFNIAIEPNPPDEKITR